MSINNWDRYEEELKDRVRAGELTQEEANNTVGTMVGMKLGGIASVVAMGILCPGVGTVAAVAILAGGAAGGAALGNELTKPK